MALVNRTPAFLGPVNHLRKTGALLLCRTACAWHGFLACTSVHSSMGKKRRLRVSKNGVCTTVRKKKKETILGPFLCSYPESPTPAPPGGTVAVTYMPLFRNGRSHTGEGSGSARKLSLCHKAFSHGRPLSPTSEWILIAPG